MKFIHALKVFILTAFLTLGSHSIAAGDKASAHSSDTTESGYSHDQAHDPRLADPESTDHYGSASTSDDQASSNSQMNPQEDGQMSDTESEAYSE